VLRHRWRTLAGAGLGPVVVTLVLLGAGCGGSGNDTSTAGAPVVKTTEEQGQIGNIVPDPPPPGNQTVDPDLRTKGGADVAWVIRSLGNDRFELSIQNTSRIGYLETFDWRPPSGDTIESVTESSSGSCSLTDGQLHCESLHLKPPACLCQPGGTETVTITMHTSDPDLSIQGSGLVVTEMTPILKNIPSRLGQTSSGV
jgi:hypothetical protein